MSNVARVTREAPEVELDIFEEPTEPIVVTKVKTKAKGIVSIKGDIVLKKSAMSVLEKFSEKHKKPIEVIAINEESRFSNEKQIDDKIKIYIPVDVHTFHNRYSLSLNGINKIVDGKKINSDDDNDKKVYLMDDDIALRIFGSTPATTLYIDNGDGASLYLAFAIKNEVLFACDVLTEKSPFDEFSMKALLLNIFKEYEREELAFKERTPFDRKILDSYMNFIRRLQTNSKTMLKNRISELMQEISGHYRAVQNLEKQACEAAVLSASLARKITKNKHDTDINCVMKMIEPLLTQNKYKYFEFSTDGLAMVGYTELIKIKHRDIDCQIGEFKVTVKLDGTVLMENITNKKNEYDHPHVHDKYPCLGNIKEQVQKLIQEFTFLPLFDLLHTYLCTYMNEPNARPFVKIGFWAVADQNLWCHECDRLAVNCICNTPRCERCGEAMTECACPRCPRSNELMINIDCSECPSWNSVGLSCLYTSPSSSVGSVAGSETTSR